MTLISIILMVALLLNNLKGYKHIWKGVRRLEDNFESSIEKTIQKAKDSGLGNGRDFVTGATFLILAVFNIFNLFTFMLTSFVTDNNPFLLTLAVVILFMGIKNSKAVVKSIATERVRFSITHVLVKPLTTLYIISFFILLFS